MPLKRHEDKPWEWEELPCELGAHGQSDCKGTMDLKDVNLKMRRTRGRLREITGDPEAPQPFSLYLEKVWLCTTCGHVYLEIGHATIVKPTM